MKLSVHSVQVIHRFDFLYITKTCNVITLCGNSMHQSFNVPSKCICYLNLLFGSYLSRNPQTSLILASSSSLSRAPMFSSTVLVCPSSAPGPSLGGRCPKYLTERYPKYLIPSCPYHLRWLLLTSREDLFLTPHSVSYLNTTCTS